MQVPRSSYFTNRASAQALYFSGAAGDLASNSTWPMLQLQERAAPSGTTGWQFVRNTIKSLQTSSVAASNLDAFVTAASKAAQKNLVPFFSAWKWSVDPSTSTKVGALGFTSSDLSATAACGTECTDCCAAAPLDTSSNTTGSGVSPENVDYTTVVTQHNSYRALHGSPALTWDTSLASAADLHASKCVYAHDATTDQGENLYMNTYTGDAAVVLANATAAW